MVELEFHQRRFEPATAFAGALFIQDGGRARPEAVRAMNALVAERPKGSVQRVLADGPARLATGEKILASARDLVQIAQQIERLPRQRHDEVVSGGLSFLTLRVHLQFFERD